MPPICSCLCKEWCRNESDYAAGMNSFNRDVYWFESYQQVVFLHWVYRLPLHGDSAIVWVHERRYGFFFCSCHLFVVMEVTYSFNLVSKACGKTKKKKKKTDTDTDGKKSPWLLAFSLWVSLSFRKQQTSNHTLKTLCIYWFLYLYHWHLFLSAAAAVWEHDAPLSKPIYQFPPDYPTAGLRSAVLSLNKRNVLASKHWPTGCGEEEILCQSGVCVLLTVFELDSDQTYRGTARFAPYLNGFWAST